MKNNLNPITIKLQMGLNQKMYANGKISYDMYSKANEILISRLTESERCDIISLNEKNIHEVGVV
jgi:hypothetical protein